MIISPSAIAIDALGIQPEGTMICNAEAGQRCAVCGVTLRTGEPIDTLRLPDSFTNHASLAIPGGEYRCGACTAVMTRGPNFMMALATCVASRDDGYLPMMKKEHRAWAFLTPPKPPFIMAVQNAQQQHTVWRAPVSLSRDLFFVRIGEQVVSIRREKLAAAREAAIGVDAAIRAAGEGAKAGRGRPAKTDSVENPFYSDWKYQDATGGQLKPYVLEAIKQQLIALPDLDALTCLTGGEIWALTAVLHLTPVRPESVTLN